MEHITLSRFCERNYKQEQNDQMDIRSCGSWSGCHSDPTSRKNPRQGVQRADSLHAATSGFIPGSKV